MALGALGKHLLDVLGRALGEAAGYEGLSSEIRLRENKGEKNNSHRNKKRNMGVWYPLSQIKKLLKGKEMITMLQIIR